MTRDEYRAHPALNFSKAKWLAVSPAHYKAHCDEVVEESPAMLLGTLTHALVLEGTPISDLAVVRPEGMNFVSKEGKAWKAEQTLPIITEEDLRAINGMAESVMANTYARSLLDACTIREKPLFGTLYGVEIKGLIDACGCNSANRWAILDLKTTNDASPKKWQWLIEDAERQYGLQAAWYMALLGLAEQLEDEPEFFWLAVEKKAPYTCVVHQIGGDKLRAAKDLLEQVLTSYIISSESNEYQQPYQGIHLHE
jgi:hypothetical protein